MVQQLYFCSFSDVETHELYIEDPSGDNCPPMFGAICCRLAALPYCCEDPVMSGNFQIQRLKGMYKTKFP